MPDLTREEITRRWGLWEWMMRFHEDCPQSECDEIRKHIHSVWDDWHQREYWTNRIVEESNRAQELLDMAKGITQRIKGEAWQ